VFVATKGGLRVDGGWLLRDASAQWLRAGVESSLRNLGTDYIDLYQVHWPDEHTRAEETAGALEALVREGKIRHIGVSNYDVKQMEELARFGKVETVQPPYHLFRRDIEDEILPYAMDHDIGVLAYGAMAHGLLTGTMTPETRFAPDDWRAQSPDFAGETFRRNLAVVERLKKVAEDRGITLPQLAVAWTLAQPAVQVTVLRGAATDPPGGVGRRRGHRACTGGSCGHRRRARRRDAGMGTSPRGYADAGRRYEMTRIAFLRAALCWQRPVAE
jgi:aryl-alcohol dehydrogenase-like predicted oxidoreductase